MTPSATDLLRLICLVTIVVVLLVAMLSDSYGLG